MNKKNVYLSVITPVYQAEGIVAELVERMGRAAQNITTDYELILVEDGSPDASWQEIVACCQADERVKGIKLSRNFGQHQAITAALKAATGQWVVVMDCDLQDDPKYIPALYKKAKEGWEVVFAYAEVRKHSWFRRLESRLYNASMRFISDVKGFDKDVANYSILSRKVVNAFLQFNDTERQYLMVLRWLGFPHSFIEIKHSKRHKGKSTYTFGRLLRLAITGLTYQSTKLLYIPLLLSGLFLIISAAMGLSQLLGLWASSLFYFYIALLLCSSSILFSIGIVGIYLSKVFKQSKNRPLFVIDKAVNLEKKDDFCNDSFSRHHSINI